MTQSKMIKEISLLLEQIGDKVLIEWYDEFADVKGEEAMKTPRETFKISDIVDQFKNQKGEIFEQIKTTADFRELVKWLKEDLDEPEKRTAIYEDTFNIYKQQWEIEHPGKSYEEAWEQQERYRVEQENSLRSKKIANPSEKKNFLRAKYVKAKDRK